MKKKKKKKKEKILEINLNLIKEKLKTIPLNHLIQINNLIQEKKNLVLLQI